MRNYDYKRRNSRTKELKKVTGDDSYKQRLDAAKNAELAIKRQKDAVKDLEAFNIGLDMDQIKGDTRGILY